MAREVACGHRHRASATLRVILGMLGGLVARTMRRSVRKRTRHMSMPRLWFTQCLDSTTPCGCMLQASPHVPSPPDSHGPIRPLRSPSRWDHRRVSGTQETAGTFSSADISEEPLEPVASSLSERSLSDGGALAPSLPLIVGESASTEPRASSALVRA